MFKTGLVGNVPGPIFKSIFSHPGFTITGCFSQKPNNQRPDNKSTGHMPVLSKEILLERSDVLIFEKADIYTLDILSDALKQSRHILLIDASGLPSGVIDELIKLREEAQTVFKIMQFERSRPELTSCLPLMNYPSLIEIKLGQKVAEGPGKNKVITGTLFRIIDILLLLNSSNIKKIQALQQPERLASGNLISSRVEFDNGTVANLLYTNIAEKDSLLIDIYQLNKHIRIDLLKNKFQSKERSQLNNEIHSKTNTFKTTNNQVFYSELDNLYQSIINNNASGKELYDISRILELRSRIIEKSGF